MAFTNEQLVELPQNCMAHAREQVKTLPVEFLGRMINRLAEAEKDLRYSNQPQIILEAAFVDLMLQGVEPAAVQVAPQSVSPKTAKQQKGDTASQSAPQQPVRKLIASEELLQQWAEVMAQIKGKSIKLHAFLAEAKPAAFQNGELILRFPHQYKFHYNTVSQEENLRLIGQVVGLLTGTPAKVVAELENEAGHIKQEMTLEQEVRKMFGDVPIEIV